MTCPGCGSDEYETLKENKNNPEETTVRCIRCGNIFTRADLIKFLNQLKQPLNIIAAAVP